MNRGIVVPIISLLVYLAIYFLIVFLKPPGHDPLRDLHSITQPILNNLEKDPHFKHVPIPEPFSTLNYSTATRDYHWSLNNLDSDLELIADNSPHTKYLDLIELPTAIDTSKLAYEADCPSNKKKRSPSEKVYCQLIRGLLVTWQLQSTQMLFTNKTQNMTIDDWNTVFMIYGIVGQALKQTLTANISINSSLEESDSISQKINQFGHALKKADFHPIVKQLKPIDDKIFLVAKINFLAKRLFEQEKQALSGIYLQSLSEAVSIYFKIQQPPLKFDQFINLIRLFNFSTKGVNLFYGQISEEVEVEHMKSWIQEGKMYYFLFGAAVVMIFLLCQVDPRRKAQKQFRHVFPSSSALKIE